MQRLGCVQLDSISTVDRSHRIALGARVGAYPEAAVAKLMRDGQIFEYWAHEACLVPIEDYPMHRWRMAHFAESHPWHGNVLEREPELTEQVLREIGERGPLGSRHFEGTGSGGMWNWKPAKVVLEALHSAGRLAIAGRDGFQRLYDLPERLIPAKVLDAPAATRDEFVRWATLRGVGRAAPSPRPPSRRCGACAAALHRRFRPHAEALVAEGKLLRLDVEDGKAPVLVPADVEPDGGYSSRVAPFAVRQPRLGPVVPRARLRLPPRHRGLQARARAGLRLLRAPLLRKDRLVGRADLKHDRAERTLLVKAFHPEPGVRGSLDDCFDAALGRLARVLGAERVARS